MRLFTVVQGPTACLGSAGSCSLKECACIRPHPSRCWHDAMHRLPPTPGQMYPQPDLSVYRWVKSAMLATQAPGSVGSRRHNPMSAAVVSTGAAASSA